MFVGAMLSLTMAALGGAAIPPLLGVYQWPRQHYQQEQRQRQQEQEQENWQQLQLQQPPPYLQRTHGGALTQRRLADPVAPSPSPHAVKPWYSQSKYALSFLTLTLLAVFLCVFACFKSRSQWNVLKLKLMAHSLNLRRARVQVCGVHHRRRCCCCVAAATDAHSCRATQPMFPCSLPAMCHLYHFRHTNMRCHHVQMVHKADDSVFNPEPGGGAAADDISMRL